MDQSWTSAPPRYRRRPGGPPSAVTSSYPQAVSCRGRSDLAFFSPPGGVAKRLHDVLAFKVRIVGEDFIDCVACTDLAENHADRNTHATDARLSTHHVGLLGNAIQMPHYILLPSSTDCISKKHLCGQKPEEVLVYGPLPANNKGKSRGKINYPAQPKEG